MSTSAPRMRSAETADRRRIVWVEHGPFDATPVIYCHGSPGAPAEVEQFHGAELADQLGARLIVVARPGVWHSTAQPGRRIADWVADAGCVADACGIDRFALLGYSAGVAYAAAVALQMPARVMAAALVAPVDHGDPMLSDALDRPSLWCQRQALVRPRLTRAVMRTTLSTPGWRSLLRVTLRRTPLLRRPDHVALRDRRVLDSVVHKSEQAFVAGVAGPQEDMALMMQPWGFDPSTIDLPVAIWQGSQDTLGSTVAMAESLHHRIAGSRLTLVDDGHLSTMTVHATAIMGDLLRMSQGCPTGT